MIVLDGVFALLASLRSRPVPFGRPAVEEGSLSEVANVEIPGPHYVPPGSEWRFRANTGTERAVLEQLAALTGEHGSWEAARRVFGAGAGDGSDGDGRSRVSEADRAGVDGVPVSR
ncbi:hypothetical protein E1286_05030 [Nonomuraea terrae]|uniref:Uncharacterized protein n=1 Tax=Nonomuraea terrae TaxID=2530383 RepID=A0A4V2YNJ1_9ACTN|nr:hypothetical protein [Nonomuraea terrae]TDD54557.1 hypothetical protein E1286_05030 [Nonomuraea terrae]